MTEKMTAQKIVSQLKNAGFQAVFAGGCVRDMMMGVEAHDIDIATSATPDQVEKLFKRTVPVGKQFGVIIVLMDDFEFEVATFRMDSKGSDGRRPDSVEFSGMEEDAKRRDLTINGLFLDPLTDEVFDFVGGRDDLDKEVIRLIGNPQERIDEDRLRLMRVVRFAARFGFHIESETFTVVEKNAHRANDVSAERVKAEMDKMLLTSKPSTAFVLMHETGLLRHTLPEVDCLWSSPQSPKWHSEGDVGTHTMMVLDATRKRTSDLDTLWAALLHDVGKPGTMGLSAEGNINNHGHDKLGAEMTEEVMRRLKASNDQRETVVALVADHMKAGEVKKMKKSTLRRFVAKKHFSKLVDLIEADCEGSIPADKNREDKKFDGVNFLKEFAATFEEPTKLPDPLVTGKDLLVMGMKPGPEFGVLLRRVSEEQLEGNLSNREEALEFVKEMI